MNAAKLIEIAEAEIGYAETFDNLTKYGEAMKANGLPWCGSFVNWCSKKAKIKIPNTVSTVSGSNAFKKLNKWVDAPVKPEPGWIAYFDFPSQSYCIRGFGQRSATNLSLPQSKGFFG